MIGRYRIVSLLGKGGMGEVYLAHDTWLKRDVALKMLPPASAADPETQARLEHEAQVMAAFSHRNIAAIHDLAQSAGQRCLVIELVKGETLDEKIERNPLTVTEALPLFGQIAAALDAAHRAGIIHRDLKPNNIKITPEGLVKVLDFGIAKILKDNAATAELPNPAQLEATTRKATLFTSNGKIIGTVPYMSPEQTRGQPVDQRADIWAFGCVCYEALTGRLPFEGKTARDSFLAINSEEPDWQALPAATPPALRELLQLCLQKEPERRLKSAAEAWHRLKAAHQGGRRPTQPARPPQPAPPPAATSFKLSRSFLLPALLGAVRLALLWQSARDP
jgi:serine/threonine-protein kinase